jgi:hypothetical protein
MHVPTLQSSKEGWTNQDGWVMRSISVSPTSRPGGGVVLQEKVLFNRRIRDNIALTDPGAPPEAVIQAAKLAGTHEFILELPEGYGTMVGEHGATLSGGQRRRIVIALPRSATRASLSSTRHQEIRAALLEGQRSAPPSSRKPAAPRWTACTSRNRRQPPWRRTR